jgi:uncharacterized protein (DUF433 family)
MGAGRDSSSPHLLNRGIYDGPEVARLIHRDPHTVASWTDARSMRPPLIVPEHPESLFSFLDLVSLVVISELARRRVPREEIYRGGVYLARQLNTSRPFAHKTLATAGSAFFAEINEWLDVGKGGQAAFEDMVRPVLRPITYEGVLAAQWRPFREIIVDPRLQAGSPCIEGTRVPTAAVLRYLDSGEEPEDVADDLELTLAQVDAAREYEQGLDRPLVHAGV